MKKSASEFLQAYTKCDEWCCACCAFLKHILGLKNLYILILIAAAFAVVYAPHISKTSD
jgi:hypothetical protein